MHGGIFFILGLGISSFSRAPGLHNNRPSPPPSSHPNLTQSASSDLPPSLSSLSYGCVSCQAWTNPASLGLTIALVGQTASRSTWGTMHQYRPCRLMRRHMAYWGGTKKPHGQLQVLLGWWVHFVQPCGWILTQGYSVKGYLVYGYLEYDREIGKNVWCYLSEIMCWYDLVFCLDRSFVYSKRECCIQTSVVYCGFEPIPQGTIWAI